MSSVLSPSHKFDFKNVLTAGEHSPKFFNRCVDQEKICLTLDKFHSF